MAPFMNYMNFLCKILLQMGCVNLPTSQYEQSKVYSTKRKASHIADFIRLYKENDKKSITTHQNCLIV